MGSDSPLVEMELESIWSLEESERVDRVTTLFRNNAEIFYREALDWAEIGRSPKEAQAAALRSIKAIAGLFPDRNDAAHRLIISLEGMIVTAMSGGKNHVLLQPGGRLTGTMKGFGAAFLAAAALAAFKLLVQDCEKSPRAARLWVAKSLADAKVSLKRDDHGQKKPITDSAIRNWYENPEEFPVQHLIASEMIKIHKENIDFAGEPSIDDIQNYLMRQLQEAALESLTY